ncbi:MAG: magnesium chelatase subunit D [Acetobacteraceae bacterium]
MNAASLLVVDPAGLGGAVLRGPPGPGRDRFLAELRAGLPAGAPFRRVPLHIDDDRLLGGLDLAATLRAGRPLAQRGLLAEADGGIVVFAAAERLSAGTAAHIAAALDQGEVITERDGLAHRSPARIGAVALDEGEGEESVAPPLRDRLAFHLDPATEPVSAPVDVARARMLLPDVVAGEDVIESLCIAAAALGIASLRAVLLALRAAKVSASLAGRTAVLAEDAALAARLVLGPRATAVPAAPEPEPEPPAEPPPANADDPSPDPGGPMADRVLAAALAALPPGLLARLQAGQPRATKAGRAGAPSKSGARGRPAGTRPGKPGAGRRLSLIGTLIAAVPWQRLRGRDGPIEIRAGDLRVIHRKPRSETTTIFLVDASGSQALNRLAEAKGAVQLLLADCYVRRDKVALVAFRGRAAELLLPPTRSLVRAKRSLAGLPGGGGTPLAAGLDAGVALAASVRRRGGTPSLVLLTDGQANVGRDGRGGRPAAERDAACAGRRVREAGFAAALVDTSARPHPAGRRLAAEMGARYLPLPYARAATLLQSVRGG